MVKFEYPWWLWLLIALLIYITIKSPSTTEFLFGGVVHAFVDVGNAILHMIADLHGPTH